MSTVQNEVEMVVVGALHLSSLTPVIMGKEKNQFLRFWVVVLVFFIIQNWAGDPSEHRVREEKHLLE